MTPTSLRIAAAAVLAFLLSGTPAWAGTPDEHFVLTPAMVQKVKAVTREVGDLQQTEAEENADDRHRKNGALPVEYFIRSLDAKPKVKAQLARQGLSAKEFGLSFYALVHGAMYLGMEPAVDKKTAADTMSKFTREQQANIALLRKMDLQPTGSTDVRRPRFRAAPGAPRVALKPALRGLDCPRHRRRRA